MKTNNKQVIMLNIYDDNDNVIKTVSAKMVKLRFGTVRSIMKIVKIENVEDTKDMLSLVGAVWDKLEGILENIFPDMTEEDWDGVDTFELLKVVIAIIRFSSHKIEEIPEDEEAKN